MVCKSCREKGCHPQDTQMYTCQKCKQQLGAKKFDSKMLNHYNSRGTTKVQCNQCASEEANLLKELHLKLKKSTRHCKCYCPLHKERCPLAPCYHGEKRWPGSDGYISFKECNFLNEINPRPAWWNKAWGKKQ